MVGQSVGWGVGRGKHSFDDPHVAPYWPTWPCSYLKEEEKIEKNQFFLLLRNRRYNFETKSAKIRSWVRATPLLITIQIIEGINISRHLSKSISGV